MQQSMHVHITSIPFFILLAPRIARQEHICTTKRWQRRSQSVSQSVIVVDFTWWNGKQSAPSAQRSALSLLDDQLSATFRQSGSFYRSTFFHYLAYHVSLSIYYGPRTPKPTIWLFYHNLWVPGLTKSEVAWRIGSSIISQGDEMQAVMRIITA